MVTCGCYDIDAVNFVPTARLVVATNTLPPVDDSSDGFWRRAIMIPHNVKTPEAEQDKQLADKIIHGELRGLHLALWGLARLKEQGRFTSARRSEKAREQYRRDNDPIGTFLQEEVVKHGAVFSRIFSKPSSPGKGQQASLSSLISDALFESARML
jgi:phage/plasmid-associated DNA primase